MQKKKEIRSDGMKNIRFPKIVVPSGEQKESICFDKISW